MHLQISAGVTPYTVQHGYSLTSLHYVFIMLKTWLGYRLLVQFDLGREKS